MFFRISMTILIRCYRRWWDVLINIWKLMIPFKKQGWSSYCNIAYEIIYKNVNFYLIIDLTHFIDDWNTQKYENFIKIIKILYRQRLLSYSEKVFNFSKIYIRKKKKKNCFDRQYWYKVDDKIHAACETFWINECA